VPMQGDAKAIAHFKQCAGDRFPMMANYSFDYGDAHFLCLDSNLYVNPNNKSLQDWIAQDLDKTDAAWKFVVFHHPAFNVGAEHYTQQHMRVLSPIFEKYGVTIVFHGHEHNYQRTMPLKFVPTDTKGADKVGSKSRLVPGDFTLDVLFDGKKNTKPNGVIYITTGAGGKHLYDPEMNTTPASWQHQEDNNVAYISRFVSDRHSLTVIDMDSNSLTLTQIDQWGAVIDTCRVTR
jgi:acid phosphatase type 7